MNKLFSAIRFITILPIGNPREFDAVGMTQFFPIVGLLLGLMLAAFDQVAMRLWNAPTAALLDVILLALLTGGFHLDGLGDTADGLFSHRSRERALEIMKDSRIGSMGLLAVVLILAIKWVGIMNLGNGRSVLLIIIPAYARGATLFGFRFLPYGRPGGGTGHAFFEEKLKNFYFWALAIPVALSFVLGTTAIVLNFGFLMLVTAILLYYKKQMGCITGDMLGAMIEFTEAAMFLMVTAGGSIC